MSIESFSLAVPAEQRAGFLVQARLLAQRARACQSSDTELDLALRVLSVLCGAASSVARGGGT